MAGHDGYTRYTTRIPTPLYERVKTASGEKSVNAEIVATLEEKYPSAVYDFGTHLTEIIQTLADCGQVEAEQIVMEANKILSRENTNTTLILAEVMGSYSGTTKHPIAHLGITSGGWDDDAISDESPSSSKRKGRKVNIRKPATNVTPASRKRKNRPVKVRKATPSDDQEN